MWVLLPIIMTIGLLGLCAWGLYRDLNRDTYRSSRGGSNTDTGLDYMQENARQELYGSKYNKND